MITRMTLLRKQGGLLLAALFLLPVLAPSSASAETAAPQWTVTAVSRPTNFKPGDQSGEDSYHVALTNTGGAPTDGSPVLVTDELPQGLSFDPSGASGEAQPGPNDIVDSIPLSCIANTCVYSGVVAADQTLLVSFPVDVTAGTPRSVTNVVRVTGGGAPGASVQTPTQISSEPAQFGLAPGGEATALSSLQAGAHADLTSTIVFNSAVASGSLAEDPKNVVYNLPPGFAGDLIDTPSCPAASFRQEECKSSTQVGIVSANYLIRLTEGGAFGELNSLTAVYNLTPNPGEVAKLGFQVGNEAGAFVEGGVYLRGDYGLETVFENAPQNLAELIRVSLTLWGVPADPIHDPVRLEGFHEEGSFGHPSESALAPFFTSPTACSTEPLQASFSVTSWQAPDATPVKLAMPFGPIVGCDRLTIEPSLSVEPTSSKASSSTGLALGMKIPQTNLNPHGLATSTVKQVRVTLPAGMTVNPSAGAGLAACDEAQLAEETAQFVPGQGCPSASKLGEVHIVTPAISEAIPGSVYLATPAPNGEAGRNPFNSLLALYIVARLPERGIIVKAAGQVTADPLTGQLVTTFDDLPPLPFSSFTFEFHSGATAPLVTPPACGNYKAEAELSPYSSPAQVLAPPIGAFAISSGFDGGACPLGGLAPFAPGLAAGTLNNSAGTYSAMDIAITRNDGEQEITGFSSQLPPGLTANLTGVPFCSEAAIAQAKGKTGAQEEAAPSCPAASEIGHTVVEAGVGSVLAQAPGKIYMAGPYEGAPFSVVAITSAKVGPFDLGTVVVRLPLLIDRETAQVRIPAGANDQIPHIIKGIVVHVRNIYVYVDKPRFTLNPTSCAHQTFAVGVIGSGQSFTDPADDVPATVNDPFQAANCASLAFKPSFKASVTGQTSKAGGAGLKVNIAYPNAPQGTEANIHTVKVELPIQLPSRLTTLQKACLASVFEANPASCPATSVVGRATAVTPILPVALTGPAYFVSYGNAKFPELVFVLQGYGVTIDLHGETFISKKGITSSTFRQVPDQPVTSFELTLPQGPYSALTANTNLCTLSHTTITHKVVTRKVHGHAKRVRVTVKHTTAAKLNMPTEIAAQNGMLIRQATPIAITGCTKAKPKKAKKAGRHQSRAHSKRK